jgi:hypothetical protein
VSSRATVGLFAATIFLNAALLFVLEPMFGKMALPLLGGSAAVWTTCMLFFQAALLGGYVYAHVLAARVGPRSQVAIHAGLLCLAALALPISIPHGWTPGAGSQPELSLLLLLTLRIGAPFVLLAGGSPLLQHWFSRSPSVEDRDPYALYIASNLGSILALLAYPFAIEPWLRLGEQARLWSIGYAALILLAGWCGLVARRRAAPESRFAVSASAPVWKERLHWMVLAAVPSSLLLAVTTHITTDLAPIPLLWVVPLALYLLTFVVAFGKRTRFASVASALLLPYLVIACTVLLFLRSEIPGSPGYVVHVAAFFVCALACHLRLAAARPPATHLTEFYVWLSVGGAVGGLFNVLIAPNLFRTVLEYPIALIAAAALSKPTPPGKLRMDLAWAATLAVVLFAAVSVSIRLLGSNRLAFAVILGLGAIAAYSFRGRAYRFALGVAAIVVAGLPVSKADGKQLLAARSFYGVYRVVDDSANGVREFLSGTTVHGTELLNDTSHAPLAYYHRDGPLGSLFASRAWRTAPWRVGVVGLGAGATASYANADEAWTFYELDPLVVRVAEDPRFFQYLEFAKARPRVIVGDARVSLERDSARVFDVMIIDAFSSDAIPTHLLTREALSVYRSRLAPDGLIAWHISNRYADLRPVLDALSRDAGLVALIDADDNVPPDSHGRFPSIWVVTTPSERTANALRSDPRWLALHTPYPQLWTDDFSNLLRILHWGW